MDHELGYNQLVAQEIHGSDFPGAKYRHPFVDAISKSVSNAVTLNDTEENLLKFIRKNVNFSHRGTLQMQIRILNRYKHCYGIDGALEESHVRNVELWIREKRFICWRLGALFDVAFPNSLIKQVGEEKRDAILSKIEGMQKPQGIRLEFTEGNRNTLNHIGIIGMTRREAINFMQRAITDLVE